MTKRIDLTLGLLWVMTLGVATPAWSGQESAKDCVEVVPGQSLGTLSLGLTVSKAQQLGFVVNNGVIAKRKAPWDIYETDGKLTQIAVNLTPATCLSLHGTNHRLRDLVRPVKPKSKNFPDAAQAAVAALLEGCGVSEMRTGGTVISCTSGALVLRHMGGAELRVLSAKDSTQVPVCTAYIVAGVGIFPGGARRILVKAGKHYCDGSRIFEQSAVQPDIGRRLYDSCNQSGKGDKLTVTCPFDGIRFEFADGKLVAIETVKQR